MTTVREGSPSAPDGGAAPDLDPGLGPWTVVLSTLWFGLVAGWLELVVVLAQRAYHPYVAMDTLRTNRHFAWMIPVSDVLIFGAAGLAAAAFARSRREASRRIACRLGLALGFLAVLLNVRELHAAASVLLACGLATIAGRWLERRADAFDRLVRRSLAVMGLATVLLAGVCYHRVESTEHRALAALPPARTGAPNVVLIVLDTVRASCMSLHGHPTPTTPNLERLAQRGIVFTEARATAPWTTPSHASLLTGRWPFELSAGPNRPLDATYPTLAEELARQGYATSAFVGNFYYCSALHGMDRGFVRYEGAYENRSVTPFETVWSSALGKGLIRALGYSTDLSDGVSLQRKTAAMVNRDALSWLDRRPADRPFFALVNYYDAHRPYQMRDKGETRFGMASLPRDVRHDLEKTFWDLKEGLPAPDGVDPMKIELDGITLLHDSYDSCIGYLDRQVGLLVDELERRGLMENTFVIVTSDHGEQFGEHGLIAHGASVYRPEAHVPLVIVPPSHSAPAASAVIDEPVSLRDVPATVAAWTGLGPQGRFPGRSLMRFLEGSAADLHGSPVLCELRDNIVNDGSARSAAVRFDPARSLVSRDRVYIRHQDGREELYDRLGDPMESSDLARDPASRPVLERFRQELSRLDGDAGASIRR